jgi:hypothetical protein
MATVSLVPLTRLPVTKDIYSSAAGFAGAAAVRRHQLVLEWMKGPLTDSGASHISSDLGLSLLLQSSHMQPYTVQVIVYEDKDSFPGQDK